MTEGQHSGLLESYRGQGDHREKAVVGEKYCGRVRTFKESSEIGSSTGCSPSLLMPVPVISWGAGGDIAQACRRPGRKASTVGYRERTESVGGVVDFPVIASRPLRSPHSRRSRLAVNAKRYRRVMGVPHRAPCPGVRKDRDGTHLKCCCWMRT